MHKFVHSILSTPYVVKFGDKTALGMNEENMGLCKIYAKEILVSTEKDDCTEEELRVRTKEILAHEIFHAFVNEAGIDLDPCVEEQLASFYMKNWEKMSKSIHMLLGMLPESLFDKQ